MLMALEGIINYQDKQESNIRDTTGMNDGWRIYHLETRKDERSNQARLLPQVTTCSTAWQRLWVL